MWPAQPKPSFNFPQKFQILFLNTQKRIASKTLLLISLSRTDDTNTPTSIPHQPQPSPLFTITKMPRPRQGAIQFWVLEGRFKRSARWWNLGFPYAIPVVNKWGKMQIMSSLWLAMSVISQCARIVLSMRSKRVGKYACAVAPLIMVRRIFPLLLYGHLFLCL